VTEMEDGGERPGLPRMQVSILLLSVHSSSLAGISAANHIRQQSGCAGLGDGVRGITGSPGPPNLYANGVE